jgi:hypothetical protein
VSESESKRGHGLRKCIPRYIIFFSEQIFWSNKHKYIFCVSENTGNLIANTHDAVKENTSVRKSVQRLDRCIDVHIHAGVRDYYFFLHSLLERI